MKPGNGKKAKAPCGHDGEHIIGTFVQCLRGCTSEADDYPTIECCPQCSSLDVDVDFSLDAQYFYWNPGATRYNRRCEDCGACWRYD